jgi:hypothetical protein
MSHLVGGVILFVFATVASIVDMTVRHEASVVADLVGLLLIWTIAGVMIRAGVRSLRASDVPSGEEGSPRPGRPSLAYRLGRFVSAKRQR